jgi:hypothetical protein
MLSLLSVELSFHFTPRILAKLLCRDLLALINPSILVLILQPYLGSAALGLALLCIPSLYYVLAEGQPTVKSRAASRS